MKEPDVTAFKKMTTLAVLAILLLHVVIVLLLTFVPVRSLLGKSRPARVYEHLIHLGPFYREESIQSSPHVILSYQGKQVDLVQQHHARYLGNPSLIHELLLRDYARRV